MAAEFSPEWREMRVGSGTVRYLVAGAGEPVILLHGLSGSVAWWGRNLAALARDFRVHAIDLVHHGGWRRSRFVLGDIAEHLAAWMPAAGLARASFVGHSMGGHIAARLAAEHPELVEKLVLVNAAALFPRTGPKLAPARLLRWLPTFPPLLAPILLRDALRAGPLTLWQATRDLLASDLRPNLEAITAPTLILWGDRDGLLPVELAHELHAALPSSELRIFPGAGHNPMWETPAAFNEAVRAFLHHDERPGRAAGI